MTLCGGAPASTRAVSPRQLPTDHDYAVSTREYQSDQRRDSRFGHHRCCIPERRRQRKNALMKNALI